MGKRVAILQSNYIPWKGYFNIIAAVDEFVIYDDMQYTRRDWRNRNQIKTPAGLQWITVPVQVKGKYYQTIYQTRVDGTAWMADHWKSLQQNYRRAPYFAEVVALLEPFYLGPPPEYLSSWNRSLIDAVCAYLNIKTKISSSSDFELIEGKSERLISICKQAGATEYVSGPSAKGYCDEALFLDSGLVLTWFDYTGYPEYPQQWGDFCHNVSIVDLLFNCGKRSVEYMKYLRP